jgi:hypothetical protein
MEEHLRLGRKRESLGSLCGGFAYDFNSLLVPLIG